MQKHNGKWISNAEYKQICQDNAQRAQELIKECMENWVKAKKSQGLLISLGQLAKAEGGEIERIEKIEMMKREAQGQNAITVTYMEPPGASEEVEA